MEAEAEAEEVIGDYEYVDIDRFPAAFGEPLSLKVNIFQNP